MSWFNDYVVHEKMRSSLREECSKIKSMEPVYPKCTKPYPKMLSLRPFNNSHAMTVTIRKKSDIIKAQKEKIISIDVIKTSMDINAMRKSANNGFIKFIRVAYELGYNYYELKDFNDTHIILGELIAGEDQDRVTKYHLSECLAL